MTLLILALPAGLVMGYLLERGDLCFHSTLRGLMRRPRETDLFRAYLLGMLIAAPLVLGMRALGVIDPWVPPWAWQANIIGGTVFGVGMVVASTCVSGLFYKTGHGMLGAVIGLAGWAVGDIATYIGPLAPLRNGLRQAEISVGGEAATLLNVFGSQPGVLISLAIAAGLGFWLWRAARKGVATRGRYWAWPRLGIAIGLVIGAGWLLARAGDSNYPYGTSSIPTQAFLALMQGMTGGASAWVPVTLLGIIPGAFLAAVLSGTLWVRGETLRRYVELAIGGLIMGVGAGIAGGCNLGHSLIGAPLLSLGSITTTVFMAVGVWLAHHAARMWTEARSRQKLPQAAGG